MITTTSTKRCQRWCRAGSRKIANVADGIIASGSKETVNGGQLQQASTNLTRSGLNFTDAAGNAIHRNLGSTLRVNASTTQKATGLNNSGEATAGAYSTINLQTYAMSQPTQCRCSSPMLLSSAAW
ncbi:MAG: hypothetical protein HGB15_04630 [Chlorobaculum sp.]|nr:hypothetical protein [Chlorobaculum sp.]